MTTDTQQKKDFSATNFLIWPITVSTIYALNWVPTLRASALATEHCGGRDIPNKALIQQHGRFPQLSTAGFRHPMSGIFIQILGNMMAHKTAELATDNLLLVSAIAAFGASFGTRKIVEDVITASKKVPPRTKTPALFLGLASETLREYMINRGCVNSEMMIKTHMPNAQKYQELAASTALAVASGAVSGLPNFMAISFYANAPISSVMKVSVLRNLLLSCGWRSLATGVAFGLAACVNSVLEEEPVSERPNISSFSR